MSLAAGWTADGWRYSVYWNERWFQVELTDKRKEIWRLIDVEVKREGGAFVVLVLGRPLVPPVRGADLSGVLEAFARRLGKDLEARGSDIIRGRKLKVLPYGETEQILSIATPRLPTIAATVLMRERAEAVKPPISLPRVREAQGLGSEGMRRLRVLFESTLQGLGIKPSPELKVRAEEIIYRLEGKYKDFPRDEAVERAINEFLKWVEEEIYFKA